MISAMIFGTAVGWFIGIAILVMIAMYVLPWLLPLLGCIIGLVLSGLILSHFAGYDEKKPTETTKPTDVPDAKTIDLSKEEVDEVFANTFGRQTDK